MRVPGRLVHSPNLADASRFHGGAADKKENLLLVHGHIVHKGRKEWVMLESPLSAGD